MTYATNVVLASTFISTATNYVSTGASSTLSTLSQAQSVTGVWPGGNGFFQAGGTFGAGTASLAYIDAIGNSVVYGGSNSLSSPGYATFALPYCTIFASGGGTSAGRTVQIQAQVLPYLIQ